MPWPFGNVWIGILEQIIIISRNSTFQLYSSIHYLCLQISPRLEWFNKRMSSASAYER